jgi:putrescine aminotransferase
MDGDDWLEDSTQSVIDSIIDKTKQYVNPGLSMLMQFGGFGDVEASAQGCVLTTMSGKEYLDFVGGFGVFTLGHRHPAVVGAAHAQLDKMPLSTRTFFNEPQALLAERLANMAPGALQYTFFSNSGTEAVEAALKFARIATGKTDFISTEGSYHGKTMGSLAVTGREKYRTPFHPMVPGTVFVPFNDLDAALNAITSQTAGIIVEPIQGEGGIIPAQPGYMVGLRKLCDSHGLLLIVDEVQTGLGRTGYMFAVERDGVIPDLLTLAKALGGGVAAIGATIGTPKVWERVFGKNPLIHTSTFGGNQLACAAGLAALDVIINENLCASAVQRGSQLITGLGHVREAHPKSLKEVRGAGLMIGVEFFVKDVAELTINFMAQRGIIAAYTLNNPNVIRFEPPLIVTEEQVDTAIEAFSEAVTDAEAMLADIEDC